jgi:hypothetical protein
MNVLVLFPFPGAILCFYGVIGIALMAYGLFGYRRATLKRPWKGMDMVLTKARTEAQRWRVPEAALPDLV